MAEKKLANLSFRTQPALKEEFERALGEQREYGSSTGYFEDCMRALIVAVRAGQRFPPPLQFITRPAEPKPKR
jgi:hypothetical protein